MATMKDVARLAGVSHGTVSNVVNGAKNVSVDKIKKVEAAMKKLGYTPNNAARNLMMDYTNQIDLVVPNLITGEFLSLYEAIRHYAEAESYTVNLKVTDGIPHKECDILNQSLMNNVDGVILVTCQPGNLNFFNDLMARGLKILFCISDLNGSNCNYVGIDMSDLLEELLYGLYQEGKRVALITGDGEGTYHDHLISTYVNISSRNRSMTENFTEVIQISPEFAGRGAAQLFQLDPIPDVVIASNEKIALEIHGMEHLLSGNTSGILEVITLNQAGRIPLFTDRSIPFPQKRVAYAAFQTMLSMIREKKTSGFQRILIAPDVRAEDSTGKPVPLTESTQEKAKKSAGQRSAAKKKAKLRILLNSSPASAAVEALLPHFSRIYGIEAEVTTRSISQVYDLLIQDRKKEHFDLYSIDLPWMQELTDAGQIACLDDFFSENQSVISIYPEEVLDRFSKIDGHAFAVPFSFSAQLLFYRKDLFGEIKNQRYYFEEYGEELRVPQNWEELNKVARIFTREYTPDSETKYGVTMGGSPFSGASCEFLPRLWSMGGSVFDKRGYLPKKDIFIKAMENYLESFRYANPKAVNWWWDEQVNEFVNGHAAMMMTFTEHANALSEKTLSRVAGKYGIAVLPGQTSVLGGWSMAMRQGTPHVTEAQQFLKWISLRSLMEPNAILGRVYPVTGNEALEMMGDLYEWFDTAVESFRHSRARTSPSFMRANTITTVQIERVLGQCIHRAILEKMNGREAVHILEQQLQLL